MDYLNKHLLLVEDDQDLAQLTQSYLSRQGFEITVIDNGLQAVTAINNNHYDLIILDIMLPQLDGLGVCQQVRAHCSQPILMMTARNDSIDQILGLEIGADDYITKPVEPRLLLARIKALLRRASLTSPQLEPDPKTVSINALVVNDNARSVFLDGQEITLSNTEYELLWLLISNAGDVLSRKFIFENLRGIDYDGCNRTIDINISRIRAKLGEDPVSPQIIKTVRNRGYLLSR